MKKLFCLLAIHLIVASGMHLMACTGISLTTVAGDLIQARTIEWGESNLNSTLIVSPPQFSYTSILPDSSKGLSWTSRYGFVGISVSLEKFIGEGVNEMGLSAGIFYFKGYGSLAAYSAEEKSSTLVDMDFVRWILGSFSTVDELLANLSSIKLVPVFIGPNGEPSPTGHWRVADKTGKNVVIEIIDHGEVHIYDNIGVLTNSPGYDWHLTNLGNYLNIQPGTIHVRDFGTYQATALGAGTAALGLPGDITPPSRFVRAAFYLFSAPTYRDPSDAVQEAFHILDNFDIPVGSEFTKDQRAHIPSIPSATQWTSASDLTNLRFYYKTMYDSSVKYVDIRQGVREVKTEMSIPLDSGKFTVTGISPSSPR